MFSNTCAMTLAQKSDRILAQTRGLSGATPNATQLIEELRWALEENRREVERLTTERDEARRTVTERRRERDEARGERDEARREVCQLIADQTTDAQPDEPYMICAIRGWDCFKEAKP